MFLLDGPNIFGIAFTVFIIASVISNIIKSSRKAAKKRSQSLRVRDDDHRPSLPKVQPQPQNYGDLHRSSATRKDVQQDSGHYVGKKQKGGIGQGSRASRSNNKTHQQGVPVVSSQGKAESCRQALNTKTGWQRAVIMAEVLESPCRMRMGLPARRRHASAMVQNPKSP